MCGIGGIKDYREPVSENVLKQMQALLRHRGPDGKGLFISPDRKIGLTHTRLSIIDLTDAGHQPMHNEAGDIWLVHNGELYNYQELQKELVSLGHKFKSKTDSEVIIHGYEEWGVSCLERFNGMWAFALWDGRKGQLFAARDRFGVKPFYYCWDGYRFVFASEIKAVLTGSRTKPKPNDSAVFKFLVERCIDDDATTFFHNIKQLRPSHYLVLCNSELSIKKYWDINVLEKRPLNRDTVEEYRELFSDAVRLRLRADVPVASTLSGGLDSSSIVRISHSLGYRHQQVFSVVYDGNPHDEARFAEEAIKGTDVSPHWVRPKDNALISSLERLIEVQEEPFADGSMYAHFEMMRAVKECGIKVILSGQGGDEILGGYVSNVNVTLALYLMKLRPVIAWKHMRNVSGRYGYSLPSQVGRGLYHLLPWFIKNYLRRCTLYRSLADILNTDFLYQHGYGRFEGVNKPGWTVLDVYLYETIRKWALPGFLHYEDRNSMAFGIETRQPFLDYRLVEFMFNTVDEAKVKGGELKVLHREAMEGMLPAKVRLRKDKQGFFAPIDKWLLSEWDVVRDIILSQNSLLSDYLNNKGLLKLLNSGMKEHSDLIWRLLILAMWCKVFHSISASRFSEVHN